MLAKINSTGTSVTAEGTGTGGKVNNTSAGWGNIAIDSNNKVYLSYTNGRYC